MKRVAIVVVAAIHLSISPASAQSSASSPATVEPEKTTISSQASGASPESKMVETWLNMSGHFNDRLLTTVYWSLGAVGGLLVVLTGFSWFLNFRVYERDKAAMLNELLEAHRKSFRTLEASIVDNSNKQIQFSLEKIKNEIHSQNEKYKEETKKSLLALASRVKENRQAIDGINVENEMKEAEHWKERAIAVNEIGCYVRAIEYAIGSPQYEWRIADALKGIGDLLASGKLQRGDWETDFMQVVPKIPPIYQTLKERALNLLAKT